MSEPEPKADQFWSGVSVGILFVVSAVNLFLLLFLVPKFKEIFADALPGKQLPTITEFILAGRIALVFVALAWPIMGTILIRLQKRSAMLWIVVGTLWTILQIGITVVALIVPMEDMTDITGMPARTTPKARLLILP